MAQRGQDLLSKLADRGEQVIGRITDLPGAKQLMDSVAAMGHRVEELQKRVRGLEALEKRVDELERRVNDLSPRAPSSRGGTRGTTKSRPPKASTKASGPSTGTRRRTPPKED